MDQNQESEKKQEFEDIKFQYGKNTYPFVAVKNLIRDFEIGDYIVQAIHDISLEIQEHEYVAIIGASGAGKTTLLHIIARLDKATQGQIYVSHVDISPMETESLSIFRIFNIGLVFQNYNLISSLTALENVMFPLQLSGCKYKACEERAKVLLQQVGLQERSEHLPFQLSAGEQQRVAIARALANDPPIIIADEPTANLDKKNAEYIAKLFENLRQEGKTVIVATHEDSLIKQAHRVIEMEEGKIIKDTRISSIDKTQFPEQNVHEQ